MNRSYVKDYIDSSVKKIDAYLTKDDTDALIDSILFDWNEIGDPESDFEELVDWNVEQYFSHSKAGSEKIKRIDFVDRNKFIPYNREWFEINYKPKPKYFMLRKQENGWDRVYYYLDKKNKSKIYIIKILLDSGASALIVLKDVLYKRHQIL